MPSKEKNEQAKWTVIREWDDWAKLYPDDVKKSPPGLYFPLYFADRNTEFLDFQSRAVDKWHTLHGCLFRERRVKD